MTRRPISPTNPRASNPICLPAPMASAKVAAVAAAVAAAAVEVAKAKAPSPANPRPSLTTSPKASIRTAGAAHKVVIVAEVAEAVVGGADNRVNHSPSANLNLVSPCHPARHNPRFASSLLRPRRPPVLAPSTALRAANSCPAK